MKKRILFIYRSYLLESKLNSKSIFPKDFLYGMDKINSSHIVDSVFIPRARRELLIEKLFFQIEKPFHQRTKLGLPLEILPLAKKQINEADIIIGVNDAISLSLLTWKKLGLIRGDILALMQSLPERHKSFNQNTFLVNLISNVLNEAKLILTLSDYVHDPLNKHFKIPKEKLKTFYFGVDTDYWKPSKNKKRGNFILSVGNDMNRDYGTLIEAVSNNQELVLVTNENIDSINKNVTVLKNISDSKLRELYQTCFCTVIPSKKLKYESSGLSTSLQAISCGSPLIVSDAPPLKEVLVENQNCLFYKAENAKDLNRMITKIKSESLRKKLKEFNKEFRNRYTTSLMSQQFEKLIGEIKF